MWVDCISKINDHNRKQQEGDKYSNDITFPVLVLDENIQGLTKLKVQAVFFLSKCWKKYSEL